MRRYRSLIRVHRPVRDIATSKRRPYADFTDVYGVDLGGTLEPDKNAFDMAPPGSVHVRTGVVAMDAGKDAQPGYLLEIKKVRVEFRTTEAVTAAVSTDPVLDDTELVVDDVVGFAGGDHCILTDASGSWTFRLKDKDATNSELDLHVGVPRAFTSATVAAKSYWVVDEIIDRPAYSQFQYLKVMETVLEDPST